MDRAIANALKRKAELEKELATINSFLDLYRHFSGPEGEQVEPHNQESRRSATTESMNPRVGRRLRPPEIADLAERVIREVGHPMTRAEIVAALENVGIQLHSDDKPRYLGTILWREKDRFINVAGEGYTMKDMAETDETDDTEIDDLLGRGEELDYGEKDESVFK